MEGVVHERLTDDERFDRAYEFAARHLAEEFHTAAVLDHEKLRLYAARGLIGTGITGGPDDIKRVVELLEERGIRLKGEHVALVVGHLRRQGPGHEHRPDPHRAEPGESCARQSPRHDSARPLGRRR